jgi:hypothetical protein
VKQYRLCMFNFFYIGIFLLMMSGCKSEIKENTVIEKADNRFHTKKMSAAVDLDNTQMIRIDDLTEQEIVLTLISSQTAGVMQVALSASDGLSLVSAVENVTFELAANKKYAIPLRIKASSFGRYYINLHITINRDEQPSSRVISAIVQVGEENQQAQLKRKINDNSAENINIMPAEETILKRE